MKAIINWMAENHVTTNLVMILVMFLGAISLVNLKQEVFPEIESDTLSITVPYIGASPDEVENSVIKKLEEAVSGIDGVKEIMAIASENVASMTIFAEYGEDIHDVKTLVQSEVDRITSFPDEIENPVIKVNVNSSSVIQLAIYGSANEKVLTRTALNIREELLQIPVISQVGTSGLRNYELYIEVSKDKLENYNLTIEQIAGSIKKSSLDLPGGKLTTSSGEILLRTMAKGSTKEDYENIVITTTPLGNTIKIGDVAKVVDGFEDGDIMSKFDTENTKLLTIYRVGKQGAIEVADAVKKYILENEKAMPSGVKLSYWKDGSRILKERIDLLLKNALMGLILVILSLALFLEIRLAFWVSLGIAISFLGGFIVMSIMDVSINMITLFAFIVVLGIVVDDAIVVGENIFARKGENISPLDASKMGANRVSVPVVFAVLTTVAAFMPLAYVEGMMGKVMGQIPVIVIGVLLFSLFESLLILPAHLSTLSESKNSLINFFNGMSKKVNEMLQIFLTKMFTPFLKKSLNNRYLTLASSVGILIISLGLLVGGVVKYTFMPEVEGDNVIARINMPTGTSYSETLLVLEQLEKSAMEVLKEYEEKEGNKIYNHIYSIVGEQPSTRKGPIAVSNTINSSVAEVNIELLSLDFRKSSSKEIMDKWREATGEIPEVKALLFVSSIMTAGKAISYNLSSTDEYELERAVQNFKEILKSYDGVVDIVDDFEKGKMELKFKLKPLAESYGITGYDLANQVRQGFYGMEILKLQRGNDEVSVKIRYPVSERNSLDDIEDMMIRTRKGTEIPFSDLAEVKMGRGYSKIVRLDRSRIITVSANVNTEIVSENKINIELEKDIDKMIKEKFNNVTYTKGGSQKEQQESMASMLKGFIVALFIIYLLLAIPFKSYVQPLVIMSAIPFGIIGAIIGHLIMGYTVSMISGLGIIALAGVVVNDSLVLVELVNEYHRDKGYSLYDAIILAAGKRFRPIMLTSLTTFLGLLPMIFETSLQARFLIPMAISLGFGVIFATGITLIFIPSGMMFLEDIKNGFSKLKGS